MKTMKVTAIRTICQRCTMLVHVPDGTTVDEIYNRDGDVIAAINQFGTWDEVDSFDGDGENIIEVEAAEDGDMEYYESATLDWQPKLSAGLAVRRRAQMMPELNIEADGRSVLLKEQKTIGADWQEGASKAK